MYKTIIFTLSCKIGKIMRLEANSKVMMKLYVYKLETKNWIENKQTKDSDFYSSFFFFFSLFSSNVHQCPLICILNVLPLLSWLWGFSVENFVSREFVCWHRFGCCCCCCCRLVDLVTFLMDAWPIARGGFVLCYIAFVVAVVAVAFAAINEFRRKENRFQSNEKIFLVLLRQLWCAVPVPVVHCAVQF